MVNKANSRMKRGSGIFKCNVCERSTRDTGGDNTQARLCEECWEIAGLENEMSDNGGHYTPEQMAACEKRYADFKAACIAKGGKL